MNKAERDELRAHIDAGHEVTWRSTVALLDALDAAEQRIRDLKFAMGDEAGWFDRFTAERKRADAAERRAAEAEGISARLRDSLRALIDALPRCSILVDVDDDSCAMKAHCTGAAEWKTCNGLSCSPCRCSNCKALSYTNELHDARNDLALASAPPRFAQDADGAAPPTEHPDELRARRKLQVIEPEYAAIMALLTDESMSAVEQIEALQKSAAEGAGDTALLKRWGEAIEASRRAHRLSESEALTWERESAVQAARERALALARGGR